MGLAGVSSLCLCTQRQVCPTQSRLPQNTAHYHAAGRCPRPLLLCGDGLCDGLSCFVFRCQNGVLNTTSPPTQPGSAFDSPRRALLRAPRAWRAPARLAHVAVCSHLPLTRVRTAAPGLPRAPSGKRIWASGGRRGRAAGTPSDSPARPGGYLAKSAVGGRPRAGIFRRYILRFYTFCVSLG
jgi:hypothetical protein